MPPSFIQLNSISLKTYRATAGKWFLIEFFVTGSNSNFCILVYTIVSSIVNDYFCKLSTTNNKKIHGSPHEKILKQKFSRYKARFWFKYHKLIAG